MSFRIAGGRAWLDHTIPIPIGEGLGPAVTAYTVVVLDKRAERALIKDPLPQEVVWRRFVVTSADHNFPLG
ncbi:hypothetical protein EAS61_14590 [Bradyrhizobium zhanjiangense]|uniref:Uncharacterized protein n=1 Tax=Bradyrhizobium zhanjiangense TaxID=1325107 RepID=A0A4Q0QPH2_9BRAD|nr:hypothetical protein EAS61_14590 [Bradyrhizobium zhanjiangense]